MPDDWFAIVELLLVFGVVFAFGWHQLRDLARYREADAAEKDKSEVRSDDQREDHREELRGVQVTGQRTGGANVGSGNLDEGVGEGSAERAGESDAHEDHARSGADGKIS